jgi:homoserine dehydrogenase
MIGIGTVGAGTFRVLARNQAEIAARAGRGIEVVAVAARNWRAAIVGKGVALTNDPLQVATRPDVDVLVEVAAAPARTRLGAGRHRARQARGHGQQGAAGRARRGDLRRRACAWRGRGLRGRGGGEHPHHQGAARGAHGQPHRVGGGYRQRHHQLHPEQDARRGHGPGRRHGTGGALGRGGPELDIDGSTPHKLALLAANAFGMPVRLRRAQVEGITALQAWTWPAPSNWATASSCWPWRGAATTA